MAIENSNDKPRLFGLKFALSLVTGLVTSGLLAGLVWVTLEPMIKGISENAYAFGNGTAYVALIASLIVFGAIYFVSTYQAGKYLKKMRAEHDAVRVLSIIFAVMLAIPAVIMLISFVVPLVQLGVGTVIDTNVAVASCVCSILSFAVFAKMICYHVGFRPKLFNRKAYTFGLGAFAIIMVVLFMIFPGAEIRKASHDQMIIDDLSKIDRAIDRYADRNDLLPEALSDLGSAKLNQDIEKYTYTALDEDSDSGRYLYYEICADGFQTGTNSEFDKGYLDDFYYHSTGKACFTRDVYMGYYYSKPAIDSVIQSEGIDYWLE